MQRPIPTDDIATTQAELKERLRIAREKQDRFLEGLARLELGALAQSCGDQQGAELSYNVALTCFSAIQNTNYQGKTLNLLGSLEKEKGNEEEALVLFRRVLTEFGTQTEIPARGDSLLEIGLLIVQHGNAPVAKKWFDEALAFFKKIADVEGEIRTRLALAQVHELQSNFDAAENEARTALMLASDHKLLRQLCEARGTLGRLIGLRSPAMGLDLINKALVGAQEQGVTAVERACRVSLAEAYHRDGDVERAYRALADAYAAERTHGRAERSRYQTYLNTVRMPEPKADMATVTTSLDALRTLLKSSAASKSTLGVARVQIDHANELRAEVGEAFFTGIRDRVVTLIQMAMRSGDILACEGTSEFVVALPGATSRQARRIAERLRNTVSGADWSPLRPELTVTLSIGLCVGASGSDPETVLDEADRCLDECRASGPNNLTVSRAAA